jgi:hypothetical protein
MIVIEDDFIGASAVQNPVHRAVRLAPHGLLVVEFSGAKDLIL